MTELELPPHGWSDDPTEDTEEGEVSSIERNAIKLQELEKEWSVLGALREITFIVLFGEESEADSLVNVARENGFDAHTTGVSAEYENGSPSFRFEVKSTRCMEPTAEAVTYWEEWFRKKASAVPSFIDFECDEHYGAAYVGWRYPSRVSPAFFIRGDSRSRDHTNASGARDRTAVLFGKTLCEFEASNGWATNNRISNTSPTFELVPSEFLKNAHRQRPSSPEPTASAFSQWLYSLYANAFGSEQDRARGKEAEEYILVARRKAYAATDQASMRKYFPGWQLKHNGLGFYQTSRPNYFNLDDLLVAGEPLRVLPDLMYENKTTGEIMIVEIKHSQMDIPSNLWPNIWGQLWCYAQIRELRNSPKITVVGEVWGDKYYGRGEVQYAYMRASVRRNPRAKPFDRFFRTLFDIYRGSAK